MYIASVYAAQYFSTLLWITLLNSFIQCKHLFIQNDGNNLQTRMNHYPEEHYYIKRGAFPDKNEKALSTGKLLGLVGSFITHAKKYPKPSLHPSVSQQAHAHTKSCISSEDCDDDYSFQHDENDEDDIFEERKEFPNHLIEHIMQDEFMNDPPSRSTTDEIKPEEKDNYIDMVKADSEHVHDLMEQLENDKSASMEGSMRNILLGLRDDASSEGAARDNRYNSNDDQNSAPSSYKQEGVTGTDISPHLPLNIKSGSTYDQDYQNGNQRDEFHEGNDVEAGSVTALKMTRPEINPIADEAKLSNALQHMRVVQVSEQERLDPPSSQSYRIEDEYKEPKKLKKQKKIGQYNKQLAGYQFAGYNNIMHVIPYKQHNSHTEHTSHMLSSRKRPSGNPQIKEKTNSQPTYKNAFSEETAREGGDTGDIIAALESAGAHGAAQEVAIDAGSRSYSNAGQTSGANNIQDSSQVATTTSKAEGATKEGAQVGGTDAESVVGPLERDANTGRGDTTENVQPTTVDGSAIQSDVNGDEMEDTQSVVVGSTGGAIDASTADATSTNTSQLTTDDDDEEDAVVASGEEATSGGNEDSTTVEKDDLLIAGDAKAAQVPTTIDGTTSETSEEGSVDGNASAQNSTTTGDVGPAQDPTNDGEAASISAGEEVKQNSTFAGVDAQESMARKEIKGNDKTSGDDPSGRIFNLEAGIKQLSDLWSRSGNKILRGKSPKLPLKGNLKKEIMKLTKVKTRFVIDKDAELNDNGDNGITYDLTNLPTKKSHTYQQAYSAKKS